ncbi:MAG: hypothetical protein ACOYLE_07365 [Bacteroidales bacterium]
MKRNYVLLIAICMMNIANAQQKNHAIPNLGKEAINNPLNDNLPNHASLKQKATNTIIWNYDTIITYKSNNNQYQRLTQTFNNNGNLITNKNEYWQSNAWVNNSRSTYTYDSNGNKLTDLSELWQTNAWINNYKATYTYDANGNMLTSLWEIW